MIVGAGDGRSEILAYLEEFCYNYNSIRTEEFATTGYYKYKQYNIDY